MKHTIRFGWIFLGFVALSSCVDAHDSDALSVDDTQDALLPAPTIASLTPATGPTSGGTVVTIIGADFGRGVFVLVDGDRVDAERVQRTELRLTMPAHAAGAASVVVSNGNGCATQTGSGFTYVEAATALTPPAPSAPTSDAGSPPAPASCSLQQSGPVKASMDGQVIENLRITSTSGPAIDVSGFSDVVIRNVEIYHEGGPGISFDGADGLHVDGVRVVRSNAPAAGPLPEEEVNIEGAFSSGVVIENVRLEQGSSGVYLLECPRPVVRLVEGHDFRGPFPRGQLVQFDKCDAPLLEDFSAENPPATSWPEDNVSFFQSPNAIVRRGVLIGNNSPSGVGVMFEAYAMVGTGGLVEDVDAVDMGNGSFSAYPSHDVTFRRTRSRDGHCGSQAGRGAPVSNALIFAGSPESSNLKLEQGSYAHHCNANILWDASSFSTVDVVEKEFAARAPLRLSFCWSPAPFGP